MIQAEAPIKPILEATVAVPTRMEAITSRQCGLKKENKRRRMEAGDRETELLGDEETGRLGDGVTGRRSYREKGKPIPDADSFD